MHTQALVPKDSADGAEVVRGVGSGRRDGLMMVAVVESTVEWGLCLWVTTVTVGMGCYFIQGWAVADVDALGCRVQRLEIWKYC